jgi:hypothetical protein
MRPDSETTDSVLALSLRECYGCDSAPSGGIGMGKPEPSLGTRPDTHPDSGGKKS